MTEEIKIEIKAEEKETKELKAKCYICGRDAIRKCEKCYKDVCIWDSSISPEDVKVYCKNDMPKVEAAIAAAAGKKPVPTIAYLSVLGIVIVVAAVYVFTTYIMVPQKIIETPQPTQVTQPIPLPRVYFNQEIGSLQTIEGGTSQGGLVSSIAVKECCRLILAVNYIDSAGSARECDIDFGSYEKDYGPNTQLPFPIKASKDCDGGGDDVEIEITGVDPTLRRVNYKVQAKFGKLAEVPKKKELPAQPTQIQNVSAKPNVTQPSTEQPEVRIIGGGGGGGGGQAPTQPVPITVPEEIQNEQQAQQSVQTANTEIQNSLNSLNDLEKLLFNYS